MRKHHIPSTQLNNLAIVNRQWCLGKCRQDSTRSIAANVHPNSHLANFNTVETLHGVASYINLLLVSMRSYSHNPCVLKWIGWKLVNFPPQSPNTCGLKWTKADPNMVLNGYLSFNWLTQVLSLQFYFLRIDTIRALDHVWYGSDSGFSRALPVAK